MPPGADAEVVAAEPSRLRPSLPAGFIHRCRTGLPQRETASSTASEHERTDMSRRLPSRGRPARTRQLHRRDHRAHAATPLRQPRRQQAPRHHRPRRADCGSVTNAIEDVLHELRQRYGLDLPPIVIYRDTTGAWDGVAHIEGTFRGFYAIRETGPRARDRQGARARPTCAAAECRV